MIATEVNICELNVLFSDCNNLARKLNFRANIRDDIEGQHKQILMTRPEKCFGNFSIRRPISY